jgi:hypothetical protein
VAKPIHEPGDSLISFGRSCMDGCYSSKNHELRVSLNWPSGALLLLTETNLIKSKTFKKI